jgi:hypothetical protein
MPLLARNGDTLISSYSLSESAWENLRAANRRESHLRACCCDSPVICKTSALGTPFFAHKAASAGPGCSYRAETELHLEAKVRAARAGQASGWDARVECAAPDGSWRADVMFSGPERLAFEIQASPISAGELKRRHERYAAAGIRCIWLLARPLPDRPSADLPVFRLVGGKEGIHVDQMPGAMSSGSLTLEDFTARVLGGRLRWTPWLGDVIPLEVWIAKERCRTGLHDSRQVDQAVLQISKVWPGTADVVLPWAAMDSGSRANELMAHLTKLPFEKAGISRPRRRESGLGVFYGQGCHTCGKSSWRAIRSSARPWMEISVKASAAWGQPSPLGAGFPYQWWWGDRAAALSGSAECKRKSDGAPARSHG